MGRELLTPTKKPQLSGFFYPLKIREGFEPHPLFFLNKIMKLQGVLGRNLLLTNRAMEHYRGTS